VLACIGKGAPSLMCSSYGGGDDDEVDGPEDLNSFWKVGRGILIRVVVKIGEERWRNDSSGISDI
jgi:hypothetical protein